MTTRPRDVALFTLGQAAGLLITFVSGVIVARWLGPGDFGVVSLARAIYGVAAVAAPLGLDLFLLKHLGAKPLYFFDTPYAFTINICIYVINNEVTHR